MAPPVSVPCPAVLDMGRKVVVGMVIVEPTNQQYTIGVPSRSQLLSKRDLDVRQGQLLNQGCYKG
eukprot:1611632-Rhodomonas_salina.1